MKTPFNKPLEKLFALGASALDNLHEVGSLNAEAVKKLGAIQADLAEASVAFGGKQFELLGNFGEPAKLLELGKDASSDLRTRLEAYATSLRGVGEELYSGYTSLVQRTFEKQEAA